MARLKHIIKFFEFSENNRSKIELGASVRLNPTKHRIQLKDTSGIYPTTLDLYAKTWTTTPRSLKRWVGFMADVTNYKDITNTIVTDVRYRLSDGTTEMYWNTGANAWVAASSNNWNTEAEVANNIASFPVSNQTIQVIINPSTSDATVTPEIRSISILYESDLEELEEYVWRTLLPAMRSQIRPIAEHSIQMAATSNVIDLNDFNIETPYNIVGIDAVYDITQDAYKLSNLFSSFDSNSSVITLSASIPQNNVAFVRFIYEPVVAVSTSQDYTEIEKVPEILIEDISIVQDLGKPNGPAFVLNKGTGNAKKIPIVQADIECNGVFITDKAKDHARLSNAINRFFSANVLIKSVGMDDEFRLWLLDVYQQSSVPSQKELHTGRFRFRIVQAVFFDNDGEDAYGTLNFDLTLVKA